MASDKSIVLITGGNAGIGFELASQLLADPSKHVLLGSRSVTKGSAAVKDLQSRNLPGTVELLEVDVSSADSITAAAKSVESKHGRIDALVNNAAVALVPGSITEQMNTVFLTNVTGTVLMAASFAPLLAKSPHTPRIVNVSSSQGSMSIRLDPSAQGYNVGGVPYRSSKAALNMVTTCLAVEYGGTKVQIMGGLSEGGKGEGKPFKVFSYCPGFTISDLSPHNTETNGAQPTSEGARPMVAILDGEKDSYHGGFLHGKGTYSW